MHLHVKWGFIQLLCLAAQQGPSADPGTFPSSFPVGWGCHGLVQLGSFLLGQGNSPNLCPLSKKDLFHKRRNLVIPWPRQWCCWTPNTDVQDKAGWETLMWLQIPSWVWTQRHLLLLPGQVWGNPVISSMLLPSAGSCRTWVSEREEHDLIGFLFLEKKQHFELPEEDIGQNGA